MLFYVVANQLNAEKRRNLNIYKYYNSAHPAYTIHCYNGVGGRGGGGGGGERKGEGERKGDGKISCNESIFYRQK